MLPVLVLLPKRVYCILTPSIHLRAFAQIKPAVGPLCTRLVGLWRSSTGSQHSLLRSAVLATLSGLVRALRADSSALHRELFFPVLQ